MDGLTLSRLFYEEAARPIIESVIAPEHYSAGLIGWSSEVLGLDDRLSRDHNWGPRFIVFLQKAYFESHGQLIDRALRDELPVGFEGYSTNFGASALGDQRAMRPIKEGPVNHFIQIERVDNYLQHFLNINTDQELDADDWLLLSEHNLLGFTEGLVFHDGLGELGEWRSRLSFYPDDVWRRLLIKQWRLIAEEEAFVGRSVERGDTLGSLLLIGRIAEHLMRLVFLMERSYAPYSKWFGTCFMQLKNGPALVPHLTEAVQARTAREREAALAQAYIIVTRMHNQLGITPPIEERIVPPYKRRPGLVLHANRFAEALEKTMRNE